MFSIKSPKYINGIPNYNCGMCASNYYLFGSLGNLGGGTNSLPTSSPQILRHSRYPSPEISSKFPQKLEPSFKLIAHKSFITKSAPAPPNINITPSCNTAECSLLGGGATPNDGKFNGKF